MIREGAAHGTPRRGRQAYVVSMDTSVPGQQDASDAALVDMLMLEAPVGLALFGSDLRFRWVNAALTRLSERSGERSFRTVETPTPTRRPGTCGPRRCWPEHVATRAGTALRKVLDEGMPLAERGYPVMSPPAGGPASSAAGLVRPRRLQPRPRTRCGCASWFPVHDAAGKVFGAG